MGLRRTVVAMCTLAGLVGAGVAFVPTAASAEAQLQAWTPPAGQTPPTLQPRTDLDKPWHPSTGNRFTSVGGARSKVASPQAAPAGTAAAAPGIGELAWFSFEKFPLTKSSIAQVNVANGNLLVKATDLSLSTPGYGLQQARFYNGLSSDTGTLGGGWGYNASNNDVYLDVESTTATLHSPNGAPLVFTYSNKKWVAPSGSNMTLTQSGSGDLAWTATLNRSGDKLIFDGVGRLEETTDRNGAGEFYNVSEGQNVVVAPTGQRSKTRRHT